MESGQIPEGSGDDRRDGVTWLKALYDPVAGLHAYQSCIDTADLGSDGDNRLLAATMQQQLRVYRGKQMVAETILLDIPVSLCAYYMDDKNDTIPTVAVAAGPHIFYYHNMKPHLKYTLDPVDLDPQDQEIWKKIQDSTIEPMEAYEALSMARDEGTRLCSRSLDVLAIDDPVEIKKFITARASLPVTQQTVITTLCTMKKSMDDDFAQGMLVVGTEAGEVIIMAPKGSTVLNKYTLRSPPAFFAVHGLYDVEYRIVVACRDGKIYSIKNQEILEGVSIQLEAPCCGLVVQEKFIYVACMDSSLHCYHTKGRKLWSIMFRSPVSTIAPMNSRSRNFNGLFVALKNGEVRLYKDRDLISTYTCEVGVTALKFGKFGREDDSLVMLHSTGALSVLFLPRSVNLDRVASTQILPPEQDIPLNVPKKTKLYVEQTQRERDDPISMHKVFQNDLFKMRLNAASSYVKVLSDNKGPVSHVSENASLRVSAIVQGIGPHFRIKLSLTNTGQKTLTDVPVSYDYNRNIYRLKEDMTQIGVLVPSVAYKFDVDVWLVDEGSEVAETIKIFVLSTTSESSAPLVTAIVNMPMPELIFQD